MPYTVSLKDVFSQDADAAVLCIENPMLPSDDPVSRALAQQGGAALLTELSRLRFLSVGRAKSIEPSTLPFSPLLLTAAPHWNNGESNELKVLSFCYRSVFSLAEELGVRRLAIPFLSTDYYRFPQEEALRIAFREAAERPFEIVFLAENEERYALSQRPVKRPRVLFYVGHYRDHAVFALESGLYAFVDLRPELREVSLRSFYDACYLLETDPRRPRLSANEIEALQSVYEESYELI